MEITKHIQLTLLIDYKTYQDQASSLISASIFYFYCMPAMDIWACSCDIFGFSEKEKHHLVVSLV